jgi:protein disulfide-isomerase
LLGAGLAAANMVELNASNFHSKLEEASEHGALVMFHASWCGHCKALMPTFKLAAEQLVKEESKIQLLAIDAAEHQEIGAEFKVSGYPTLKVYHGGSWQEYDGGRSQQQLIDTVRAMTGPAIVEVTEVPEPVSGTAKVVIRGPELNEKIQKLAGSLRSSGSFVFVKEATESVTVQHLGETPIPSTLDTLAETLKQNAMPRFGEINRDTFGKYAEDESMGMVWFFFDNSKDDLAQTVGEHGPVIREMAQRFPGYNFGYIDTKVFAREVEGMFGLTTFPACVIQPTLVGKAKFTFDREPLIGSDGKLAVAPLELYLSQIISGEVQPVLQSKPDPENRADENGVTEVVGSTMKEILLDTTKSVFLGVFASWCGHCKAMKPAYESIARRIRDSGLNDTLLIAQMDGTENESHMDDVDWKGFPTLLFFNKGVKVEYSGGRDEESIWNFLVEQIPEVGTRAGAKVDQDAGDNKEEL